MLSTLSPNPKILILFWFLLTAVLFVLPISLFDFYSDDFGYFLNFYDNFQKNSDLDKALISYLTGGVPRLQVGWHITHQVLFFIFGRNVSLYFLLQAVLIFLNAVLFYMLAVQFLNKKIVVIATTFIIAQCFFRETFYWVSANYGFFQIFYLLISYHLVLKAIKAKSNISYYTLLFVGALFHILALLFQEQTFPLLTLSSFVLYLIFREEFQNNKLVRTLIYFMLSSITILILLFLPQFFLISSSSKTSLVDTLLMYYPTPFSSSLRNAWLITRQTFLGFVPDFHSLQVLMENFKDLSTNLKISFFIQTFLYSGLSIEFHFLLKRTPSVALESINKYKLLGLTLWLMAVIVVVLPITEFVSRYIYLMLPPALLLALAFYLCLIRDKFVPIIFSIAFFFSCLSQMAYMYGAHFPLVALGRSSTEVILERIRSDQEIKAVVFLGFPSNYKGITSGVFLNYHAAEWSLRWKSLPDDIGLKAVGNKALPCKTENGNDGYQMEFGAYPKERLLRCYEKSETLFAKLESSFLQSPPQISLYKESTE